MARRKDLAEFKLPRWDDLPSMDLYLEQILELLDEWLGDYLSVKGKRVILIDDVFTTGSTSNECSKLLKSAKSESVTVLTFATARVTPELY